MKELKEKIEADKGKDDYPAGGQKLIYTGEYTYIYVEDFSFQIKLFFSPTAYMLWLSERLASLGIRGAQLRAPLMPRDASLSDSKWWNSEQKIGFEKSSPMPPTAPPGRTARFLALLLAFALPRVGVLLLLPPTRGWLVLLHLSIQRLICMRFNEERNSPTSFIIFYLRFETTCLIFRIKIYITVYWLLLISLHEAGWYCSTWAFKGGKHC